MITFLKYAILAIAGICILVICNKLHYSPPPRPGEYYLSDFLRDGYTIIAGISIFALGCLAGYFFKLNPWLTGISLIAVFPLVCFYEATVYRGSHNLLPFELFMYFLFALPGIAGAYVGKFFSKRLSKVSAKQ